MIKNKFCHVFLSLIVLLCGCSSQEENHYIGEEYLGAKYIYDPLGEEKAPDKDPLIRTDAFDCLSFVETVLAGGDVEKLNQIRYKNGEVNILTRNHFMEVDWLKNNAQLIEDVTKKYGKTKTKHVIIDKKNWFKRNYNMDTDFEKELVEIEYIPYETMPKLNIKEPMIILFLCDGEGFYEHTGSDLTVIHTGFLLPGNILRHASNDFGIVMDADLTKYMQKIQKTNHNIGFMLLKIK